MNIIGVEYYYEKLNPNRSVFFPIIKDKLIQAKINEIQGWEMFAEFLFFEKAYLLIKKYILENNLNNLKVYDVGCNFGFQSEIFLDMDYIGIDYETKLQINKDLVSYLYGDFRKMKINLDNSFVISNMALGWFQDEEDYSDLFTSAKYLAISTNAATLASLEEKFENKVVLYQNIMIQPITKKISDFSLYLFF